MELQQVTSTLLDSVGFNAEESLLFVRFKGKDDIYSYANIPPEMYEEMVTAKSVGAFFSQNIKPFKEKFPYAKVSEQPEKRIGVRGKQASDSATCEEASPGSRDEYVACGKPASMQVYFQRDNVTLAMCMPCADHNVRNRGAEYLAIETIDFTANGTPLPATTAPAEIVIADDPEALKAQALELSERTKAIAIVSPEAYELATTTILAIARMRIALELTFRKGIQEKHAAWKKELAVLNYYDVPLESDDKRLRQGMIEFKRQEDVQRKKAEDAERQRLQAEAEADAVRRSQETQLADAIAAEQRGEPEIAKMILDAPPLPMAPVYAPPVSYASTVRKEAGISHVEDWDFEIVDRKLIPEKYKLIDEKTIRNEAKRLKGRAEIPGVRFFDRGGMRVSTKAAKR